MIYHIMNKDMQIIDIETDRLNRVISYHKYISDTPMQIFWGEVTTKRFYDFLKDRCYEDGRADLEDILRYHGLSSNNPYEWVRLTHGVTYEDFVWIKFDDDPKNIKWKDVNIR